MRLLTLRKYIGGAFRNRAATFPTASGPGTASGKEISALPEVFDATVGSRERDAREAAAAVPWRLGGLGPAAQHQAQGVGRRLRASDARRGRGRALRGLSARFRRPKRVSTPTTTHHTPQVRSRDSARDCQVLRGLCSRPSRRPNASASHERRSGLLKIRHCGLLISVTWG